MTNEQWDELLAIINGKAVKPLPVGFVIDSPWLPGWAGMSMLDYFSSEQMWFEANMKVIRQFPDIIFLPGFWSEFGMYTEPSAFGAISSWQENEMPFPQKVITDIAQAASLSKPDPRKNGMPPFVLKRLKHYQSQIEDEGHAIKFAVSRGPLNIASFLMGSTEFLMAIRTDPDRIEKLLGTVTDFIVDWLELQIETFPSIDGIFILDDIVGFLGEEDFKQTAMPYLERIYEAFNVSVKFFHNDAAGIVSAPYLEQIGINLFNFSFEHPIARMKELVNGSVTLLGNVPPRDVLAEGTADDVRDSVKSMIDSVNDKSRIILSCGGGMPFGVSTENIEAFIKAAGNN
jgi:uroporphyrinogen decarboxylase